MSTFPDVTHAALRLIKEIKETTDPMEVARLLATGKWIAVSAAPYGNEEKYLFVVGRVV